jgi:hypothetical protein
MDVIQFPLQTRGCTEGNRIVRPLLPQGRTGLGGLLRQILLKAGHPHTIEASDGSEACKRDHYRPTVFLIACLHKCCMGGWDLARTIIAGYPPRPVTCPTISNSTLFGNCVAKTISRNFEKYVLLHGYLCTDATPWHECTVPTMTKRNVFRQTE